MGSSYSYDIQPSWANQPSGGNQIIITYSQNYPDNSYSYNYTTYYTNGTIVFSESSLLTGYHTSSRTIWYQPDGSICDSNDTAIPDAPDRVLFGSYEQAYSKRPLQTQKEVADLFVSGEQNILTWVRNFSDARIFTSDYALDWFDYQAGYDVVLAQLGWGQNATQNIARIRGAAETQQKNWGTMITWASTTAPYLMSSEQMFEEMYQSYRSGADYVVVFNYNQTYNIIGGNDTQTGSALLKDEHFAAIQRFWNEVVQNPSETNNAHGSVAFVLPQYYGCAMRYVEDRTWGMFSSDTTTIYRNLQAALAKYGSELDIVYDDSAYSIIGRYSQFLL